MQEKKEMMPYTTEEYEKYVKWQKKRERERLWRIAHGMSMKSKPIEVEENPSPEVVKEAARKYDAWIARMHKWIETHKQHASEEE